MFAITFQIPAHFEIKEAMFLSRAFNVCTFNNTTWFISLACIENYEGSSCHVDVCENLVPNAWTDKLPYANFIYISCELREITYVQGDVRQKPPPTTRHEVVGFPYMHGGRSGGGGGGGGKVSGRH